MLTRDQLFRAVRARLDASTAGWLEQGVARAQSGTLAQLLEAYTAASARLGDATLELRRSDIAGAVPGTSFDKWTLEDTGRLILLLARAEPPRDAAAFASDAVACYEQGDAREQRSWLRAVSLLPDPAQFRLLVIDACRTNILPIFEAVACENPYPADYFPERNFNQVVLKALFNNVALSRIVGLNRRANPELARMAGDYAAERRAAGRSVPGDISLAMGGQEHRV